MKINTLTIKKILFIHNKNGGINTTINYEIKTVFISNNLATSFTIVDSL
jgi:hypothetical protein